VNDLESELNEERARGRLAEERIAILRAQSDREEAQRHKLEQRKNQRELRLDPNVLQMEQQIEMYKNEVTSLSLIPTPTHGDIIINLYLVPTPTQVG